MILSCTEQGFIGLLQPNTIINVLILFPGVGHVISNHGSGVG